MTLSHDDSTINIVLLLLLLLFIISVRNLQNMQQFARKKMHLISVDFSFILYFLAFMRYCFIINCFSTLSGLGDGKTLWSVKAFHSGICQRFLLRVLA